MANSLAHTKISHLHQSIEIIEGHMMPDYIHLLVKISPKMGVSQFMGYLKGNSVMMIFNRHANVKYKFGNSNLGATRDYVSTVGLNTATIQKYTREQKKQDQIEDKLSTKEYELPFNVADNQDLNEVKVSVI